MAQQKGHLALLAPCTQSGLLALHGQGGSRTGSAWHSSRIHSFEGFVRRQRSSWRDERGR